MKKISLLITALALFATVLTTQNLPAAELSVGATTWYSWWDFNTIGTGDERDIDPALLFGPALSLRFSEDYNMTFVFLYGKFNMGSGESGGTDKISRIDSDLALNYRLSSAFKIFAGLKYMSYDLPNFYHRSAGAGLGLSAVLPIGGSFYLLGNVSGLALLGKQQESESDYKYKEVGANAGLSLAYYIAPASTTISLGGRYQAFRTFYNDSNKPDIIHQFYGATLSATMAFNL